MQYEKELLNKNDDNDDDDDDDDCIVPDEQNRCQVQY